MAFKRRRNQQKLIITSFCDQSVLMGVCQSKEYNQLTFTEQNWFYRESQILPCCQVLQNRKHKEHHCFVWQNLSSKSQKEQHKYKQRQSQSANHLLGIHEIGRYQDHYYLITEEFIRLKEIQISYSQAVIIAYESLKGFQSLVKQYGGFIPRDDMIFINKEGLVKVWINDNLSKNQPSYPHPRITEQAFIESFIHQINGHISLDTLLQSKKQMEYLTPGKSFSATLKQLKKTSMSTKIKRIKLQNKYFNSHIEDYKNGKTNPTLKGSIIDGKSLRFLVGEEDKNYVRKYSLEKGENPFSKNQNNTAEDTINMKSMASALNPCASKEAVSLARHHKDIIEVQSKLIILNKDQGY